MITELLPIVTLCKTGNWDASCSTEQRLTNCCVSHLLRPSWVPLGNLLFPYVSNQLSGIQFQAIEAVVSATLGFGIYTAFD